MTSRASGAFDVQLQPQTHEESVGDASIGRLGLVKQFHGDLQGTSKGQMLAHRSEVQGSAGYVAIERVTAWLAGRSGSFVLHHMGTMNRGESTLVITVVPDSGTEELVGLSGRMTIHINAGKHTYDFDYELPAL